MSSLHAIINCQVLELEKSLNIKLIFFIILSNFVFLIYMLVDVQTDRWTD